MLAAGRPRRRGPPPAHPRRFHYCRVLAAVPGGHEPPGRHRPGPAGTAGRPRPAGRRVWLDPAAAERTRRVAALRQAPLGRLRDHRPGPAAGQAHRPEPGWRPRLERPDHHRDQPRAGRRARRVPARRHDRLVPAAGGPAPPGPQHRPHRRDPRPRRSLARRPDPVLHLPGAGTARAAASADGRRRSNAGCAPAAWAGRAAVPATSTPSG